MPRPESLASARLWLAFSIMVLVGGLTNAFPVFLPPLLAEFGGTRAAAAAGMSIFWLASAALVPVTGGLVDRRDPRFVIGAGLALAACGTAGAALAPSLGAFSLVFGIGGGLGAGLTGFVSQAAVIAETYRERRGFATGIAFSGSMAGFALASPAHWAITTIGWRWTLAAWALALLALLPLVFRYYPRRLGERPASAGTIEAGRVADVVRTVPFWALAIVFTAPPVAGYMLTLHHSLYFTARGFTATEAATMLLVGGVLSTAGRALAGFVADRVGGPAAGLASWGLSLTGALCLIAFERAAVPALAYVYLLAVFLPMGSRATIVSVLVTRIAPPGRYGTVFGLLAIGNSLGAALGPFLSGKIYDLTGSYLAIFVTAAGVIVTATTALLVFLRTAPRPRE
ncbi:MAG: MFS transporter [Candidatus Rokubacteria bacterium]|nr:MFS transporter [Candidatus Rokubacteria bacterium]